MSENNNPTVVAKDVVVLMEYSLMVDGEVVDSSESDGPLAFLQGYQNIIPGLEREMEGMKTGESKKVSIAPEDGYGEINDDALTEVDRGEFPADIPMEAGTELHVTDEDGDMMYATIVEVNDESVTLDMNHPLAGKTLDFEVKVLELRMATSEELSHGHVHGAHGHH